MHGNGVQDIEFLRVYGIVRVVVYQGLDEQAVTDVNLFILIERDLEVTGSKNLTSGFELISADVALVQDRMIHDTLAEKVASRKTGVVEVKIEGMVKRQPVKCIKLDKLLGRNEIADVRFHIERGFPEIYVDPIDNAMDEIFQMFHDGFPEIQSMKTSTMVHRCRQCRASLSPPVLQDTRVGKSIILSTPHTQVSFSVAEWSAPRPGQGETMDSENLSGFRPCLSG
jgi:hypothetical protein